MSGLLERSEEGGKTDLGTLEQRLAQKQSPSSPAQSPHSRKASSSFDTARGTSPLKETNRSPPVGQTSPEAIKSEQKPQKSERDVEDISDMMCSLMTNNHGETKYLGTVQAHVVCQDLQADSIFRFVLRYVHIFSTGHTMGRRENRRLVVPSNGRCRHARRNEVVPLETGSFR